MRSAVLAELELPVFREPTVEPRIGAETYSQRMIRLYERAGEGGFQALVVYGDREHSANLAYLTGYDPRFEESVLVMDVPRKSASLVMGHEGLGYFPISPIKDSLRPVLWQSLSLMGQDRAGTRPLREILVEAGVDKGDRVGVVGWKYFTSQEVADPGHWIEVPSFLVDALRGIVRHDNVVNANSLTMHPTEGLRAVNEVDQLAVFEYASSHTSQAVRNVVFGLRPGMTEYEAVELMRVKGMPLSCHLMLSSGPCAFMGLPSPSSRVIEAGDPFTTAYGVWGGLTCRAGWAAEDESQLPQGARDYVNKLVAPYFEAVAEWYSRLGVGVEGGVLFKVVHDRIGDPFFGVHLNPGHLLSLEEWLHSPIYGGSRLRLRSGMALQVDVIPATGSPYFTSNMEDGVALADAGLRAEFASRYPEAWDRIQARRDYMAGALGISLKPEVLPFSNIPGYLPPYLLSPWMAMKLA
jgi:hypothetical protein